MIYLPKKVCLIIIHRNTTHILDMSCCHKHQQQKNHHENTKICMFLQYMHVDILLPLSKTIPVMFQALSSISMLQHFGRLATPKRVPRNCLRYLQTTLILGEDGLISEFMWGIV